MAASERRRSNKSKVPTDCEQINTQRGWPSTRLRNALTQSQGWVQGPCGSVLDQGPEIRVQRNALTQSQEWVQGPHVSSGSRGTPWRPSAECHRKCVARRVRAPPVAARCRRRRTASGCLDDQWSVDWPLSTGRTGTSQGRLGSHKVRRASGMRPASCRTLSSSPRCRWPSCPSRLWSTASLDELVTTQHRPA